MFVVVFVHFLPDSQWRQFLRVKLRQMLLFCGCSIVLSLRPHQAGQSQHSIVSDFWQKITFYSYRNNNHHGNHHSNHHSNHGYHRGKHGNHHGLVSRDY